MKVTMIMMNTQPEEVKMMRTIAVAEGVEPVHVEMTEQEVAQRTAEEAEADMDTQRSNIIAEMKQIEQEVTPRRIREALLLGDTALIATVEERIAKLRKQLAKLG